MTLKPESRTIQNLFGQPYQIDFYQREYKWKESHVQTLLDDIFFKFEQNYQADLDVNPEIVSRFGWYYLNTIVTNQLDSKRYIVDGQQRLTTLTLILIALHRLARLKDLSEDRVELLRDRIYGTGLEGKAYWMGADNRAPVLEALLEDGLDAELTASQAERLSLRNIHRNYELIHEHLLHRLSDAHRLETFILYFLSRIELVEIAIDDVSDVAMVFEVINDRGEPLRPYEVLKGQLLSQLDKVEIEKTYYPIWKQGVGRILRLHQGKPDRADAEVDNFFRTYFRAKHTDNRGEYREFEGEYQRTLLESKWVKKLELKRNPAGVKEFISEPFDYYTRVYADLVEVGRSEGTDIYFCTTLNDLERTYLLLLSAISARDPDEKEKVALVSRLFDRHFTLLQLTGSYNTNRFTEIIIDLNQAIRDQSPEQIQEVFDGKLLADIEEAHEIEIDDPFDYRLFANIGYDLGSRFLRYFFARVEHFIAHHSHATANKYWHLVRNNGPKNGHHVEHVLADNEDNRSFFQDEEGVVDEEAFLRLRNRLGGLVLLKGRDNMSSKNERYADKVKTYSHGPLIAQTLTANFYHKNKDFQDFADAEGLEFKPYDQFNSEAVEERHQLYFELAKRIWGDDSFPLGG